MTALSDAVDTMKRWILAAIAQAHTKGKLFRAFKGPQRRYAFWLLLLQKFARIGAVLRGEAPEPPFEIAPVEQGAAVRLLHRLLRKALGQSPRVHLRRSFPLDNTLYRAEAISTARVRPSVRPSQCTGHRPGGGAEPLSCGRDKTGPSFQPGDRQKADRMRRVNRDRINLDARRINGQADVKRWISEAMRKVLRSRPDGLVMEDLSRMRGRTKSRKLSRVVSGWMRSSLKERAEFLSQAGGSPLETVNPVYTSHECPRCEYVHKDNRQDDRFQCRHCHFTAHADTVGAMNMKRRHIDPARRERIQVFTPKEVVLKRLREIFERQQALST